MMWYVISPDALHFHSWGGDFVVYNSLSGNTHLLGLVAAHILLKLQETPANSGVLASSLALLMQAEMDDEFLSQTEQLLAGLDKLALIEHR